MRESDVAKDEYEMSNLASLEVHNYAVAARRAECCWRGGGATG